MVWEGTFEGPYVSLKAGPAVISLKPIVDADCTQDGPQGHCSWGDRNIDVVMLHPNASDVLVAIL